MRASSHAASAASQASGLGLKRELGFADLALFYIAGALSLRWIATAAAAGPSTILIWIFACGGFFLPLAASVLELSSRYPQEGGMYVWTQRAFGDSSGFLTAWAYWMSNLPYFPAVLYFGAGSLLAGLPHGERLRDNAHYYLVFALVSLALITVLNIVGLNFGKWLTNLGAIGSWVPVLLLIVLAALSFHRYGTATHFTSVSLHPRLGLKNAIFWSTIFYAFAGCETGSFMSSEIRNARRILPRALLFSGVVLAFSYIAGTVALLVALPSDAISGLGGFASAIQSLCTRLGFSWLTRIVAGLIALSSIGGAAVYLSSTSRLPFVAGMDRYLPAVFGSVHPRWRTPWIAIAVYGAAGMLVALLSQAGSSVEGAYDLLVSMSVITYFIPFVFLFLSTIVLQREAAGPEVLRLPGGKRVAIALACIGLLTTIFAIILSAIPSPEEPHKLLAVVKILGSTMLMMLAGAAVFFSARMRRPTS